jgi:hypothetical protein
LWCPFLHVDFCPREIQNNALGWRGTGALLPAWAVTYHVYQGHRLSVWWGGRCFSWIELISSKQLGFFNHIRLQIFISSHILNCKLYWMFAKLYFSQIIFSFSRNLKHASFQLNLMESDNKQLILSNISSFS